MQQSARDLKLSRIAIEAARAKNWKRAAGACRLLRRERRINPLVLERKS